MKRLKLNLGLVGEKGGGKETFVEEVRRIFPRLKISHHRFSDLLADTCRQWGLAVTRRNLQKMAVGMNNEFGPTTLSDALRLRIESDRSDIVILDGIRWYSDVKMFRRLPNNAIIYITADPRVRYERLKQRTKKAKAGERSMSWKKFIREELAENERFIRQIGMKLADFGPIHNDGSREKLRIAVRDLMVRTVIPRFTRAKKKTSGR